MMPETRIEDFIRWANSMGTSDIKLTPTDPVSVRKNGVWKHVTKRPPSPAELFSILVHLTRNIGAGSQIQRGAPVNFSREITVEKNNRRSGAIRFRGNATGVSDGNQGFGPAITLRIIPGNIPSFDDIGVKPELRDILFPENGLVILSGVMGSGKTTLLAATMHDMRMRMDKAIMTLESPIEFDFSNIEHARGTLEQIQIPDMVPSFEVGVVASTRKAVDVLLVGEANDANTMEAAIHASEIGIAVYATLHTSSVSTIIPRVIHQFPQAEQNGIAASMISAMRTFVQQRLVPRVGGGRVPIQEWLSIGEDQRNWLMEQDLHGLQGAMETLVQRDGHPLLADAKEAHEKGLIDDTVFNRIKWEKESAK